MKITVDLPDDVAQRPDPGREALEALAIEAYRSGALAAYRAALRIDPKHTPAQAALKRLSR